MTEKERGFNEFCDQIRDQVESKGAEWAAKDFTQGGFGFYVPKNEAKNYKQWLEQTYGFLPAVGTETMEEPVDDKTVAFPSRIGRYKCYETGDTPPTVMFRVLLRAGEPQHDEYTRTHQPQYLRTKEMVNG